MCSGVGRRTCARKHSSCCRRCRLFSSPCLRAPNRSRASLLISEAFSQETKTRLSYERSSPIVARGETSDIHQRQLLRCGFTLEQTERHEEEANTLFKKNRLICEATPELSSLCVLLLFRLCSHRIIEPRTAELSAFGFQRICLLRCRTDTTGSHARLPNAPKCCLLNQISGSMSASAQPQLNVQHKVRRTVS